MNPLWNGLKSPLWNSTRQGVWFPLGGSPQAGGGSPSFNPLTLYAGGKKGLWIKPRDWTTLFQNSGGTGAVTVATDPVGWYTDLSGNGLTMEQATGTARGLAATQGGYACVDYDGVDDGASTALFAPGTLTASMDCYVALYRDTASNMLPAYGSAGEYFAVMESGSGASASAGAGASVTYRVNGVAVPGGTSTTRGQIHAATPTGAWLVLSVQSLNLSTWLWFLIANYPAVSWNGKFAEIILCESVDATTRAQIETYLGAQVGLTL